MTVNSANTRIFGSDRDTIYLAPVGTPLPDSVDAKPHSDFEPLGWLSEEGITETATGSVTKHRGYQGHGVVQSTVGEGGTDISFSALESKPQTLELRYAEKDTTIAGGVRKTTRSPGQEVKARAVVIDLFAPNNVDVAECLVIPRLEIAPNGDRVYAPNGLSTFPFIGSVIGDYFHYASGGASGALAWSVSVDGAPTSGPYNLSVNGYSTAPLAFNANAANIAAAINALQGVTGIKDATATGNGPVKVTFPTPALLLATGVTFDKGAVTVTAK